MPLKLIPPSKARRTPYFTVRGTFLGVYVDRSTKTGERRQAIKIRREWEEQIKRGEYRTGPQIVEKQPEACSPRVRQHMESALAMWQHDPGALLGALEKVAIPSRRPVAATTPAKANGSGAVHLPPGEKAVLIAAAQFGSVEREQLTVLTGYKRSSRDAYIQRLREKGLIAVNGGAVEPTQAGLAALPADYEPLPSGSDLQEFWRGRLPEGERRVLDVLIAAFPASVARSDIDAATGYQRSSRDAYLQRMKAKRLWEPDGSGVRASEALFG